LSLSATTLETPRTAIVMAKKIFLIMCVYYFIIIFS
jgi:hypothetical protein